jgi:hypothetical protein
MQDQNEGEHLESWVHEVQTQIGHMYFEGNPELEINPDNHPCQEVQTDDWEPERIEVIREVEVIVEKEVEKIVYVEKELAPQAELVQDEPLVEDEPPAASEMKSPVNLNELQTLEHTQKSFADVDVVEPMQPKFQGIRKDAMEPKSMEKHDVKIAVRNQKQKATPKPKLMQQADGQRQKGVGGLRGLIYSAASRQD